MKEEFFQLPLSTTKQYNKIWKLFPLPFVNIFPPMKIQTMINFTRCYPIQIYYYLTPLTDQIKLLKIFSSMEIFFQIVSVCLSVFSHLHVHVPFEQKTVLTVNTKIFIFSIKKKSKCYKNKTSTYLSTHCKFTNTKTRGDNNWLYSSTSYWY
jgi:hypothetical protein